MNVLSGRGVPMKLETMTEQEIESIVEAFADYQYENGEDGLFHLFPNKEAVRVYMRAFVRAGLKAGWFYTTSEKREGYIMISDSRSKPPASALAEVISGCIKSLGLKRSLVFLRTLKSGGRSLEDSMKKNRQEFIKIEMLAVTKPYQGQGYMRKVIDIAFQMAQERKLPCILDTDGRLKRDKYIHLGMQEAGERKIGERACLYDLIRPVNGGEEMTI